jgi:BirA family transcriptional regulator, biotin operon repressor / biotin---[acetyl-CoA-carboxylase] ligase
VADAPATVALHEAWDLDALQRRLQALWPGIVVEALDETPSTNTLLLDRARQHPQPVLLVAQTQTAGRGRLGRAWQAQPGASLTFSIGLPLAPRQWHGLSLAVGLALAEALDPAAPDTGRPALGLKWPNDLWHWDGPGRGRKLGGVLIETTALRYCVVGVGLNIAPVEAGGIPAACLQELHADIRPAAALARVAPALLQTLVNFQAHGFAPLAPAYARRDLLQGQAIHTSGPPALAGVAAGVDAEGALCVQDGATVHRVLSGEVSVRFAGKPLPKGAAC